jgi:ubiquinol-cytochrome c reductase cytochrome c1 subunit
MGIFMKALGFGLTGAGIAIFRAEMAEAGGDAVRATTLSWPHSGMFDTYDASQLRRGFQVYRQVCSACHSINKLAFRQLVGVTHTEADMKALAKEYQVLDEEPDAEGNPVIRPGKLTDDIPGPYKNEMEARASNNGALPPDFRLIRNARTSGLDFKEGEDYIYHLLTGYCDPPAGVTVAEGQYYNPYFSGGAIGMGPPLYNEIIQYEDGTPATLSQLAADVSAFLTWSSLSEQDERKMMSYKAYPLFIAGAFAAWIGKRKIFAGVKTTKTSWSKLRK